MNFDIDLQTFSCTFQSFLYSNGNYDLDVDSNSSYQTTTGDSRPTPIKHDLRYDNAAILHHVERESVACSE